MFEIPRLEKTVKKDIPNLENYKFTELASFGLQEDEKKAPVRDLIEIEYGGEVVTLVTNRVQDKKLESYCVEIIKNAKVVLNLKFNYNYLENTPVIHSAVIKPFEAKDDFKLKGLGIKMFKLMLDYFQELANIKNKSFLHEIVKSPLFDIREKQPEVDGYSAFSGMDEKEQSDKWEGIFLEFLNKEGYKKEAMKDGDEYWRKEYIPEHAGN